MTSIKQRHSGAAILRGMRHTALDIIHDEHQALVAMLRWLSMLLAFEVMGEARRSFVAADCLELDAAFAANRDPLTGHEASPDYAPLLRKILHAAPAPIGLGPAH